LSSVTATAATAAAVDAAIVAVVAAKTAVPAQTFTLTSGIDALTGSNGNDTFQGDSANIGALDKIAGGLGNDTLYVTSTAGAVTLSSNNISSIETLSFSATTATHTATLNSLTGITNVNNLGSSSALVVGVGANSLTSLAAVAISGTASNTTVVFAETAVTGSADAVTVTLSNVTGAAQVNVDTGTATATVAGAVETINIVSTGATNSIALETNDTQGLGTIKISGDQQVTIALGTNAGTDAIVLDASAATGKVLISGIGAGNNFAGTATGTTVTGGSADDTFTFLAGYIGAAGSVASGTRDVINGGSGSDTLNIVLADAVTASGLAQVNLTSIENLTISDAWATGNNLDLTRFADVRKLTTTGAIAGTSSATLNSGTTVVMAANTNATTTTTFNVNGTSVTDTMTLNMAGFDYVTGGTADFLTTGIETLNINTGAAVTDAATFSGVLTMTASAGGISGIVATGVNALTFTGIVTAGSIDASAITGILTVTAAPANAVTIRGGSAGDTINGSGAADLIVGGNGADTITGAAGNDSIDLTESTAAIDKFVFSGNTALSTQLTANGVDTIVGFGATDLINVAALGDGGTPSGLTAISGAAAAENLTTDRAIVISTTGAAANLTLGGTATVTDFTNMTQIAAYLSERFTSAIAGTQKNVIIINNTSGNNDTSYVYSLIDAGTQGTVAAEIQLMGTITHTAGTPLTAANVVYA
jgi:hypothetical protein